MVQSGIGEGEGPGKHCGLRRPYGKEEKQMDTCRKEWLDALLSIVDPVLSALEKGKLRERLPMTFHRERAAYAPLEAFGRSMLGLAPRRTGRRRFAASPWRWIRLQPIV